MTNAPNKQIRDSIRDAALDGVKEGIAVTSLSESALGLVDVLTSGLR